MTKLSRFLYELYMDAFIFIAGCMIGFIQARYLCTHWHIRSEWTENICFVITVIQGLSCMWYLDYLVSKNKNKL